MRHVKKLLVAVHDVTPAHAERCDRIFRLLDEISITQYALLVVPDWHGEWPLDAHPDFVEVLQRRQDAGADIFLHGFSHDESRHRRSLSQRVQVAGRTAGSAEFMMLTPDDARRRIDRGLEIFKRLGLNPVGFIPPAWLFGRGTMKVLEERSLAITEGFWLIRHTGSEKSLFAPAVSWSTAKPWRSVVTSAIAAARCPLERYRSVVRVAIHPPDIEVPSVAKSLRATLEGLLATRDAISYQKALGIAGTEQAAE